MRMNDQSLFFTLHLKDSDNYSFTYFGENCYEILRYSPAELCNNFSLFSDLIHEDDRAGFFEDLTVSADTLSPVHSFVRIKHSDASRYVEMRFSPRNSEEGSFAWDAILTDLREEREYIPEFSRHLDFELLVSSISTEFSGLSSDLIESGIKDALKKIGLFAGSDRSYVFLMNSDGSTIDEILFWSARDSGAELFRLEYLDFADHFPVFFRALEKLDIVYIPREEFIPADAVNERASFSSQGIKSLLIVPMVLKGRLFGFLGLDSLSKFQNWTLNDQILLRLCGEVFVNVINRKRAEEEIIKTNRLFEEIIRQSPVPTCIAEPGGNIKIYNNAFIETLKLEHENSINGNLNYRNVKAPWTVIDSEGNKISHKEIPLARALSGIKTSGAEIHVELTDGSRKWFITTEAPVYDHSNQLIAGLITFQDITRIKQYESDLHERVRELQESEARFRNYIESAPDGIFVADETGRFLDVNEASCRITGYSREQLLEQSISSFVCEEDLEEALNEFGKCKDKGIGSGEFRYISRDNNIRFMSVDMVNMNNQMYIGFAKDITETREMAEQLRQFEKMDAIGQLAGGIAHDFNNQIAIIMGYSELLVSKLEDSRLLNFAKNILASSRRSSDLTRKLLAFAHKGLYESKAVSMHKIIREVVDILSHSIDKKISMQLDLKAEEAYTRGDPSQLQNILINLALNSRDAMPDGGIISFKTENISLDETFCRTIPYEVVPGSFVKVSVSDNGSGIEDQDLSRIFEPFFTTKAPGKGTGMGLASVYGAVVNHNAVIDVSSIPGEGTEFSLYFPQVENLTTFKHEDRKLSLSPGNISILIVDDEELIRKMGTDILTSLGYSVFPCRDGPEALNFYREHSDKIDLVLLDMIMPEMGGKDVFRSLKELNPDVAVVLLSGFSMTGEIQQLLDEGACAFISKPFELGQFSEVISGVLKIQYSES